MEILPARSDIWQATDTPEKPRANATPTYRRSGESSAAPENSAQPRLISKKEHITARRRGGTEGKTRHIMSAAAPKNAMNAQTASMAPPAAETEATSAWARLSFFALTGSMAAALLLLQKSRINTIDKTVCMRKSI